jgi:hypothetical protein
MVMQLHTVRKFPEHFISQFMRFPSFIAFFERLVSSGSFKEGVETREASC